MTVHISKEEFLNDKTGRLYKDVAEDEKIPFSKWIEFFNRDDIQRRMVDAEEHFNRPPLAGIVRELERTAIFRDYLENHDAHKTVRGRQAIGVIIKIIMNKLGWKTTGRKGSLGTRQKSKPQMQMYTKMLHQQIIFSPENTEGSISKYFTVSERYERKY